MYEFKNRAVVLKRRPEGRIKEGDLELESRDIRSPEQDEVVVRVLWLSLDPYMRKRMNATDQRSLEIGSPVIGESVAQVIESRSNDLKVGDFVTCFSGWQEYATVSARSPAVQKIQEQDNVPLQAYLGVIGMPGRTGYCGMKYVGNPVSGETVVISAATGPVGTVAGYVAKQAGCRVVGIASGDAKCRYAVEQLGFDDCVNRLATDYTERLRWACPNGVDVYFESVGGEVAALVSQLLNPGARVPICGTVSTANDKDAENPKTVFERMAPQAETCQFVVSAWKDQKQEITTLLVSKVASGDLKYQESVVEGLENAIDAFKGLFEGQNFGKQLVQVAKV